MDQNTGKLDTIIRTDVLFGQHKPAQLIGCTFQPGQSEVREALEIQSTDELGTREFSLYSGEEANVSKRMC